MPCHNRSDLSSQAGFLQPLVDNGYLSTNPQDPLNNASHDYWYFSMKKTTGGPCGSIAHFGFDAEVKGTVCPSGTMESNGEKHCHIFFPELPSCSSTDPLLFKSGTVESGGSCYDYIDNGCTTYGSSC
ncbi:MAG: hypothetical protein HYT34_02505 [Candidatus Ryanbacteria bacterium]|nr:hypothetical protein [Candidatus Ryanbacteria bacterium]